MKWIKRMGYGVLILLTLMMLVVLFVRKPLPEGKSGDAAEQLANEVLAAINVEAYNDIPWMSWSFRGGHHYVWNKKEHMGIIRWGNYRVHLNLTNLMGQVWKDDVLIQGPEKEKLKNKAWSFWCNDNYWLNPIAKIKDPGTVRSVVQTKSKGEALLVQYQSGGVTPGDAYLYYLDEQNRPTAFRMWVSILPFGGIKATFEDWHQLEGAWLAATHKIGPMNVPIIDVKSGTSYTDLGFEKDPFIHAM